MPFHGTAKRAKPTMHNAPARRLIALIAAALVMFSLNVGAYADPAIFECSGIQRVFNRATSSKLPGTLYTRVFAFDEEKKAVLEYLDQKWTVLDGDAEVDATDISARYSRDYPDGRIDIIFELNRVDKTLVYIMDIDERPGEFFSAHCQVGSTKSQ